MRKIAIVIAARDAVGNLIDVLEIAPRYPRDLTPRKLKKSWRLVDRRIVRFQRANQYATVSA